MSTKVQEQKGMLIMHHKTGSFYPIVTKIAKEPMDFAYCGNKSEKKKPAEGNQ